MNKRDSARIVLSQLEVSPQFTKIVIGNEGFGADKIIVDVMAGRKFYETKRRRNVYDWAILVVRILNITGNKQLQKLIESKTKKVFGYDVKIHPSNMETILLNNQMTNVTESKRHSVVAVIKNILDNKNIGYSIFEERQ